jgi:hypothetical protein
MRFSVRRFFAFLIPVTLMLVCASLRAATTVDELRKEVEDLRKRVTQRETTAKPIGKVDLAVSGKYGPGAEVITKTGRLEIGGLLQLWSFNGRQQHTHDVFGKSGTGETIDNGNNAIRRTEIRFKLDIHENIFAYVAIDPTREIDSFRLRACSSPSLSSIQNSMRSMARALAVPPKCARFSSAPAPRTGCLKTHSSIITA